MLHLDNHLDFQHGQNEHELIKHSTELAFIYLDGLSAGDSKVASPFIRQIRLTQYQQQMFVHFGYNIGKEVKTLIIF